MSAWMLPAIILVPLLSAAVVGYFRNTWSKTMVSWVASGSVFASFVMTLVLLIQFQGSGEPIRATLTNWGEFVTLGLVADSLSLWWMVVVTGCGFLIHVYSTGYMREDESFGRFMAKLNFFIYAMSLLVLSDNFVGLLMGWANVGLASYLLIGFYIKKPEASAAAIKAFVMNILGEVGLIAGIAFIYMNFGSLEYTEVFAKVSQHPEMLTLIGILLLVGAVAKSAQVPLHTWLPYAMEGPTPVSALIHAATMVTAGVYLVSRAWPIYAAAPAAALAVAWVGGIGALFGAVVAAGQFDIKRVLAFSTLSQVGYMFMGNGLGAYVAADFHFFTHAFFKALLFLTAGIVVHHFAGDQDIRRMGGLWKKDKFAGWMFLFGALALIGLPPFAGFFSKDEILLAAFESNALLFGIGVLAAGATAFYNVRLFSLVFLGEPWSDKTKGVQQAHEEYKTPASMFWPVAILGVLSVVGGLIAIPGLQVEFLSSSFAGLDLAHHGIHWGVASTAVVVALAGGGLSWFLFGPKGIGREHEVDLTVEGGALYHMFYFDALYDAIAVRPVRAASEFLSSVVDAKIIDGAVNGLGSLSATIGGWLRVLNNGYVRRYALTVVTGVVLMLVYYIYI